MEKTKRLETGGHDNSVQEFNGKTYHLYKGERYYSRGTKRLHRVVWEYYNGPIPKGHEIHHKDGNPANNDISNLDCISVHAHKEAHLEDVLRRTTSPESIANMRRAGEFAKVWHGSEAGRKWHSDHAKREFETLAVRPAVCECCGKEFKYKSFNKPRFCSNACKSKWRRDARLDDEQRVCAYCGKTFTANHYSDTVTCSRSCAAKYRWQRRRDGDGL